jgi:hypothetical protein
MEEVVEKKLPVKNLERIGEKTFPSYAEAAAVKQKLIAADGPAPAKIKIFARYDGTFDVVWYKKIEVAKKDETKAEERKVEHQNKSMERRAETEKKHGLKAKDRRKAETKKKA